MGTARVGNSDISEAGKDVEEQDHLWNAEWKQTTPRGYILYNFMHMIFLEWWSYKMENRLMDTWVTQAGPEGGGCG